MKTKLSIAYAIAIILLAVSMCTMVYDDYKQNKEIQKLENQVKSLESQPVETATAPSDTTDYSSEIARIDSDMQGIRDLCAEIQYLYDSTNESLTDKCNQIPGMQEQITSLESQVTGLWSTLEENGLVHSNAPTPEFAQ